MTESFAGQTVEIARRTLTTRFKSSEIESAELDARLLVGAVLGLDLTGLITSAQRLLTVHEATRLEEFARRRLQNEPIARILGHREFWGLSLKLSAATLVPRPDTETVVELAWNCTPPRTDRPRRILDIGTGSGAILLALLSEFPEAYGIGTDLSQAALETARGNAIRLGFEPRAAFLVCHYAAALSDGFDLIVSNPPYIPSADIEGLEAEVRHHDPLLALDGGADGLDAYRALAPEAMRLLAPGGTLVVEVGQGQHSDVRALMAAAGLRLKGPPKADLAGIPRALAFRKMPP